MGRLIDVGRELYTVTAALKDKFGLVLRPDRSDEMPVNGAEPTKALPGSQYVDPDTPMLFSTIHDGLDRIESSIRELKSVHERAAL
jgi:hypothetical protein